MLSVNKTSFVKYDGGWHHAIVGWLFTDVVAQNSEYIRLDWGQNTNYNFPQMEDNVHTVPGKVQ